MARWQKLHLFEYGGRGDNAQSLFTSGTCAMMTQSSGSRGNLMAAVKFSLGVSSLPYWPEVKSAPQNTSIGGAALWVMSGKTKKEYKGVAEFLNFLMQPKQQLYWQQQTGYLPITKQALQYAQQAGFYKKTAGSMVAIKELLNKPVTDYSRGIRLGNLMQIRDINDTAMEMVFSGQTSPKQALDLAVTKANALLKRFSEMAEG